jgi:dTDP-4-amino-4,6-dideoxygalactose transaminase
MDAVLEITRPHKLLVVEDCAQGFEKVGGRGHEDSDLVMHSFGPIKTATALGGAVVRVASPTLRQRMAQTLDTDPAQTRVGFVRRLARFAVLKALSGNLASHLFYRCAHGFGFDVDRLINSLGRGFASSGFVARLRRRPSVPLLRLLRRRWKSYDFARIDRRRQLGRLLDRQIGQRHSPGHSYWVYPLFTPDASVLRDRLHAADFDATCLSRMTVVPAVDDLRVPALAQRNWNRVVFLPWYPELTDQAVERMAELIGTPTQWPPDGETGERER